MKETEVTHGVLLDPMQDHNEAHIHLQPVEEPTVDLFNHE